MNIRFIIVTLFTILLTSCGESKSDGKKTLSVTIDPQKYFLEQIVGDKYTVNCIVPSGSNPESYDPSPSQMIALGKSIAYFKVGYLGVENTLVDKIQQNNKNIILVDCSTGITPIGHHDAHCGHDHGHDGADPHTWSSPATAKVIADNMYKEIIKLDETNIDYFTTNYNKLIAEIDQTDSIIKNYIAKAPSKSFIIYHPALSYFSDEYGLHQYAIEHEGKNPSPSQLKQLIDSTKEEGVKVVFIQQEFDTKNAETIALSIGAKAVPINLLSYEWSKEMIKIAKAIALEE